MTGKISKSLPRPGSLGQHRIPSLGGCLQPSRIDRAAVRTQYNVKKLAGTIQDPATTDLQLTTSGQHSTGRKSTQALQVHFLELAHQFHPARLTTPHAGQLTVEQALRAKT